MKIIAVLFLLINFNVSAQLISGELVDAQRPLKSTTDFIVIGSSTGEIFYDLAVDNEGNVTSIKLLSEKTTVISTPTRLKGKQLVSELKFEPGAFYPKFHHVTVRVKVVLAKKES